jgi:hypothetical protein
VLSRRPHACDLALVCEDNARSYIGALLAMSTHDPDGEVFALGFTVMVQHNMQDLMYLGASGRPTPIMPAAMKGGSE